MREEFTLSLKIGIEGMPQSLYNAIRHHIYQRIAGFDSIFEHVYD